MRWAKPEGRWRGTPILWVLALACPPLHAQAPGPRGVLEACTLHASADVRGLYALRPRCPGLGEAIHDLRLDSFLPADWPRRLDLRQVADLEALAERYDRAAPRALPDPVSLRDIARHLPRPVSRLSPWGALTLWVLTWVRAHWEEWVRFLPQWHTTKSERAVILYGVLALVVLAAGGVIGVELYAAGVFQTDWRRRVARLRAEAGAAPGEPALEADEIARAAPRVRPVLTLRWLVAALARSHRLERERDLTCRELVTAARFDSRVQQALFGRIALLAESSLYGDPARPLDDAVLADAPGLHEQLLAAPGARQAG